METSISLPADVVIVGYGPVGQTLAALLASKGHSVAVYERFSGLYDLPRAAYFDDEIMQVWQSLGIAGELDVLPVKTYEWFGADGETILRMEHPALGPSGWEPGYVFFQPRLERALDRAVKALPSVEVHCGGGAEALEQAGDHVALTLRRVRESQLGQLEPTAETTTVRARYVIGADGANSFVRHAAGAADRRLRLGDGDARRAARRPGLPCSTWAEAGDPPRGMLELSPVTREEGFPTRAELIARYQERSGRPVTDIGWHETLALWKSAIFMEATTGERFGTTDDPYLDRSGEAVIELASWAEARLDSR